jgi:hypothetical protein
MAIPIVSPHAGKKGAITLSFPCFFLWGMLTTLSYAVSVLFALIFSI